MRNWLLGAVIAILAVTAAQNAAAAVFRYSITGTVDAGSLGNLNFDYSDAPFQDDFYVNAALLGAEYTLDDVSSLVTNAHGGESPIVAFLTVAGIEKRLSKRVCLSWQSPARCQLR